MIDKDVRQLHKYFDANDSVIKKQPKMEIWESHLGSYCYYIK